MATSRFLICEKTGQWAVALRRELASRPLRLHETRSFAECRVEVERSPFSFVAVELTADNVVRLVEWVARVTREFPEVRIVAVGRSDLKEHQWAVREAGAVHFADSPRRLAPVVRLARRRLASAPEEELTLREQVRRRLPWRAVHS